MIEAWERVGCALGWRWGCAGAAAASVLGSLCDCPRCSVTGGSRGKLAPVALRQASLFTPSALRASAQHRRRRSPSAPPTPISVLMGLPSASLLDGVVTRFPMQMALPKRSDPMRSKSSAHPSGERVARGRVRLCGAEERSDMRDKSEACLSPAGASLPRSPHGTSTARQSRSDPRSEAPGLGLPGRRTPQTATPRKRKKAPEAKDRQGLQ